MSKNTMNDNRREGEEDDPIPLFSLFSIVFEFLGYLFFPAFVGYLMDVYWITSDGTDPTYSFFIGLILGFGYGIYHMYRVAVRLSGKSFDIGRRKSGSEANRDISKKSEVILHDLKEIGKDIDEFIQQEKRKKKN